MIDWFNLLWPTSDVTHFGRRAVLTLLFIFKIKNKSSELKLRSQTWKVCVLYCCPTYLIGSGEQKSEMIHYSPSHMYLCEESFVKHDGWSHSPHYLRLYLHLYSYNILKLCREELENRPSTVIDDRTPLKHKLSAEFTSALHLIFFTDSWLIVVHLSAHTNIITNSFSDSSTIDTSY